MSAGRANLPLKCRMSTFSQNIIDKRISTYIHTDSYVRSRYGKLILCRCDSPMSAKSSPLLGFAIRSHYLLAILSTPVPYESLLSIQRWSVHEFPRSLGRKSSLFTLRTISDGFHRFQCRNCRRTVDPPPAAVPSVVEGWIGRYGFLRELLERGSTRHGDGRTAAASQVESATNTIDHEAVFAGSKKSISLLTFSL